MAFIDRSYSLVSSVLFFVWFVLLFGGFIFGKPDAQRTRRMPPWTRMASSFTLVIAGWANLWFNRESPDALFGALIALGITLGFIGDLFMARLIPVKDYVIGGIGSFGLGHIAYIVGLLYFGGLHRLTAPGALLGGWIMWLLVGAIGWYVVVLRGHKATLLHKLALPYALLLASTAGIATGLALQAPFFIPLAVGAALFLISDLILAAKLFNDAHFPLIDDVVWLTYGPGQMLIVFTAGATMLAYTTFLF
ncbi:MAG: lysoplasmalogenase [Anaerolineae bacterium]|nr:lysoplasmalogenase [Anaerolineae bacterium]